MIFRVRVLLKPKRGGSFIYLDVVAGMSFIWCIKIPMSNLEK